MIMAQKYTDVKQSYIGTVLGGNHSVIREWFSPSAVNLVYPVLQFLVNRIMLVWYLIWENSGDSRSALIAYTFPWDVTYQNCDKPDIKFRSILVLVQQTYIQNGIDTVDYFVPNGSFMHSCFHWIRIQPFTLELLRDIFLESSIQI